MVLVHGGAWHGAWVVHGWYFLYWHVVTTYIGEVGLLVPENLNQGNAST